MLGAGIFGGNDSLGLGQDAGETHLYPWGQYSDATRSLQIATNYELQQRGMPLIGEDGKLGGETCGAQSWLVAHDGPTEHNVALQLADCRSFDYPPLVRATSPTEPAPAPTPTPMPSTRASSFGLGSVGWLLIAGGVAAAGIYLARRK